jgi:predicted lipoprotein with Yx(FWY)xxD motif
MATCNSRVVPWWRGPVLLLVTALGVWVTVGGAGGAGATSTTVSLSAGSAPTTSAAAASGQPAPAGATPFYDVKTRTVGRLGTVLVNGQGLTLYMFVPDARRGRSTCFRACAAAWPPLRLPAGVTVPIASGQAKPSLLRTTTRKDGGLQVTYDGWPLYLWVSDSRPGQATGEGIKSLGGYWYVLSPKGKVIKAKH